MTLTYHKSPWGKDLLARDGMDDGEVALCADHHQDEDGCCVAETVHELVHLAESVPQHPAATDRRARSKSSGSQGDECEDDWPLVFFAPCSLPSSSGSPGYTARNIPEDKSRS